MSSHRINLVAVTGADSGLGAAICRELEARARAIVLQVKGPKRGEDFSEVQEDRQSFMGSSCHADLASSVGCELTSAWIKERTYELAKEAQESTADQIEFYPILVNCAGVNYIEWFDQADFSQFDRLMALNVKAGMMLTQCLLGQKPPPTDLDATDWFGGTGAVLNIISNASHMPMTNSAFYNASKGAFHIATLAMARELRKTHGLCVFGISPNKLKGTGMSEYIEGRVPDLRGWTPEQAAAYQLAALPAGEETDPKALAEFIGWILSTPARHKYLTNTVIPYGA